MEPRQAQRALHFREPTADPMVTLGDYLITGSAQIPADQRTRNPLILPDLDRSARTRVSALVIRRVAVAPGRPGGDAPQVPRRVRELGMPLAPERVGGFYLRGGAGRQRG